MKEFTINCQIFQPFRAFSLDGLQSNSALAQQRAEAGLQLQKAGEHQMGNLPSSKDLLRVKLHLQLESLNPAVPYHSG